MSHYFQDVYNEMCYFKIICHKPYAIKICLKITECAFRYLHVTVILLGL